MNELEAKARALIRQGLQMLFNDVRDVELSREDIVEITEQELDIIYEEFAQGQTPDVEAEVEREIEAAQLLNLAEKLRNHD